MSIPIVATDPAPPGRITIAGRTEYHAFTVVASSKDDALAQLLFHKGIEYGTPYVNEQGDQPDEVLVALEFEVTPLVTAINGGAGLYGVTVVYGYESLGGLSPPIIPGGPTRWRIRRTTVTEPADVDVKGVPVANTAGQPFTPYSARRRIERALEGTRLLYAESELHASLPFLMFEGKCNSAVYRDIFPRGSLWMEPVDVSLVSGNEDAGGLKVFRVTVLLAYRPPRTVGLGAFEKQVEGWQEVRPNYGTRYKSPEGLLLKIRDATGEDIGSPVMLTPNGESYYNEVTPEATNYKVFTHYEYADFSALPL